MKQSDSLLLSTGLVEFIKLTNVLRRRRTSRERMVVQSLHKSRTAFGFDQLGALMAGAFTLGSRGFETLDEARATVSAMEAKDKQIYDLEQAVSKLKLDVSNCEKKLKDAEDKASKVEIRATNAEKDLADVRAELALRKLADAVISDFRKSREYGLELGQKAAAKVGRSWVVAKKLLKMNPKATWDDFKPLIIAAEQQVAAGGGDEEPDPYEDPDAPDSEEEEE